MDARAGRSRARPGLVFVALALSALGLGCSDAPSSARDPIVDEIRRIVATQTGRPLEEIATDEPLSRVAPGFDDLDLVEVVMAIEERFGVEIPDAELERVGAGSTELPSAFTVERLAELVR